MTATKVSGKLHSGNYQHHLVAPRPQWLVTRHHGNLSGHNSELSGALSLHSYLVICSPLWRTSHITTQGGSHFYIHTTSSGMTGIREEERGKRSDLV